MCEFLKGVYQWGWLKSEKRSGRDLSSNANALSYAVLLLLQLHMACGQEWMLDSRFTWMSNPPLWGALVFLWLLWACILNSTFMYVWDKRKTLVVKGLSPALHRQMSVPRPKSAPHFQPVIKVVSQHSCYRTCFGRCWIPVSRSSRLLVRIHPSARRWFLCCSGPNIIQYLCGFVYWCGCSCMYIPLALKVILHSSLNKMYFYFNSFHGAEYVWKLAGDASAIKGYLSHLSWLFEMWKTRLRSMGNYLLIYCIVLG